MNEQKPAAKPKRSLLRRIVKIVLITIASLIGLVIVVALLILTPPVQNFARKKIQSYMSSKLQTRFEVGRIYIGFPKMVVLENVYIEDRQKDTLLAGGKLKVDISMFKLLKSEVEINDIELERITAKIKRTLPDTTFNFQFIIDAFAPKNTTATTDTSAMKMAIKNVSLDKIRLVYNDVITGNDMTVWLEHLDTHIDTFDPTNMRFDVPEINIEGITARIYQSKPLAKPEPVSKDMAEAQAPPAFAIGLEDINLKNINLDYGNNVSAFYTKLNLGELVAKVNKIDLANNNFDIEEVSLNNTVSAIRIEKPETAEVVAKEVEQEVKTEVQNNMRVVVNTIRLNNNDLQFDNETMPRVKGAMDYSHIKAEDLTFHVDDFIFKMDSIAGKITRGTVKEQSGFQLNRLETEFLYAANQAYLNDLIVETPGTRLQRSVAMSYPSLEALQKDIGQLQLDVDLQDSRIQVKDILTFAPFLRSQPAFANPNAVWTLNGDISGSVADLNIKELQLQGLTSTRADIRGTIEGLPDINKLRGDLVINTFRTSRRDIQSVMPAGTIPSNITLPEIVNLRGTLHGSMANANANMNITTNLGNVSVKGNIQNATNPNTAEYNATLSTTNLNLGVIMQNDTMYGPLTAKFVASGRGLDMKTANANLKGVINSVVYNRYQYQDVQIEGTLARQQATAKLNIADPNIHLALNANSDLSAEFPAITLDADIDSVKTMQLNFTPEPLTYRGMINADFPVTDPENLQGELLLTESVIVTKDQRFVLDSVQLAAGNSDTGRFVRLKSDAINAAITGQYNLVQLGTVFQEAIQPYFNIIPDYKKTEIDPYDFNVTAQVINGPLIKAFMPALERLDPVDLQAHFSNSGGWNAAITAPMIVYGTNRVQNVKLNAGTANDRINLVTTIEQVSAGAMHLYTTTINAGVAQNQVNFLVDINDATQKDKYMLGGLFSQAEPGNYSLALKGDSLLLNYDKWTVADNNVIRLNNGDINVSNFVLSRNQQSLSINSSSPAANSPLNVKFGNFRIATITAFMKQDTLLADGTINGDVVLSNLATQPTFTSDLVINDLSMNRDTLGNLTLKVNNTTQNVFAANAQLSGRGNDLVLDGRYFVKPQNQSAFDLVLDIRKIEMASLEGATMGAITQASGFINGKFDIKGTVEKPDVNGALNFNQTKFNLTMLNSFFSIDQERVVVNNEGIVFDSFTIRDSTNNALVLNGTAYTTNFVNYRLDLALTADNFMALNTAKRDNQLFYGKLFFDTNIRIEGTETNPVIDGRFSVNENTDLTIVMPQNSPGVEEREGIVRFVDMDSIRVDDSVSLAAYDTLSQTKMLGMDIALNVEIDKDAIFNLIIDEGNGDFIRMKGEAQLTGGIDPSGKINLTGSYEINEGAYELSFNMLRRRFDILKGSKIVWLGEPTSADVDVTAVYVANTAPLTLVEDQLAAATTFTRNTYKQKLPFEVHLKLDGELLKPEITFDVILPEDKNYNVSNDIIETVNIRLTQLRNEPSELNKQVFALLLMGRFISENPFASSGGGGGFNAGSLARQSVSKLLAEQLNDLAGDLIHGVDINFDVASTEDYTTGEMQNRTDLNVSLSKQLLNDRLKVTVGNNFELEGPQNSNQRSNNLAGNIALDYQLSKDGKYMIRAYRKNEYEGELDGYIIETGVNFIITLDYNHFRDLFRKKKKEDKQETKAEKKVTSNQSVPEGKPNEE